MNLRPNNYRPLFKMRGRLTCLHSEFFVNGSLGLGSVLVLCKGNDWRSFMSKSGEKSCLQKGLEVFSSKAAYYKYSSDFRAYIKMAKKEIIPRFKNDRVSLSQKELAELLPILGEFWYFYGMTEFSYHDLAYETMVKTKKTNLKKNLDDLGKLKFEGRKIMNAYLFEEGVFHNLLASLTRGFLAKETPATFLFSQELLDLFDGKKPSREILLKRQQYYGCMSIRRQSEIFSFTKTFKLWKKFCGATTDTESLTGIISYPGKVRGKVVIAPMLVDAKAISKINAIMKKGDVLVAESTTPDLMVLVNKASAIVTDQGGMLSHAAIVSRELKIPCIIATGKATHVLKNDDIVEVDANNGIVMKI